jgi:hypothetical protein
LALFAAVGIAELWRIVRTRQVRRYALWTGGLLALGLAIYQLYLYNVAGQYGVQFSLNPKTVLTYVVFYMRMAAPVWGPAPALLRYGLSFSVLLLGAWAFVRRLPRAGVVELYLLVSLGMIYVYSNNDFRYSMPLLPLLFLLATDGILDLGERFLPRRPLLPAYALGGLALVASAFSVYAIDTAPIKAGVGDPAFQEVAVFLQHTQPETLVLSWNPRVFALYTRRPSALYPQDQGAFESQIPPAAHVLLVKYAQPLDDEKLGPYLASAPRPVEFSNQEFTVYRIR